MKAKKREQRRPHKVVTLRMPPDKYEAVSEHVRGMNGSSRMGDQRMTLTGFIMRCIEQSMMYEPPKVDRRQMALRGVR